MTRHEMGLHQVTLNLMEYDAYKEKLLEMMFVDCLKAAELATQAIKMEFEALMNAEVPEETEVGEENETGTDAENQETIKAEIEALVNAVMLEEAEVGEEDGNTTENSGAEDEEAQWLVCCHKGCGFKLRTNVSSESLRRRKNWHVEGVHYEGGPLECPVHGCKPPKGKTGYKGLDNLSKHIQNVHNGVASLSSSDRAAYEKLRATVKKATTSLASVCFPKKSR